MQTHAPLTPFHARPQARKLATSMQASLSLNPDGIYVMNGIYMNSPDYEISQLVLYVHMVVNIFFIQND